jgi:hypothetical protein
MLPGKLGKPEKLGRLSALASLASRAYQASMAFIKSFFNCMVDIQEIFNRIQDSKKKQKDIKTLCRDALKNSVEYQDTVTKLTGMRDKKKKIETAVKDQYASEFAKLDALEIDVKADTELLTDAAITMLMKGERVEVQDEYKNVYDPVFSVKFKKTK